MLDLEVHRAGNQVRRSEAGSNPQALAVGLTPESILIASGVGDKVILQKPVLFLTELNTHTSDPGVRKADRIQGNTEQLQA